MNYWNEQSQQVIGHLSTSQTQGLTQEEAHARLENNGANEFKKPPTESLAHMILRQFKDIATGFAFGFVNKLCGKFTLYLGVA
ncbi:cation-transporting P-type ATPase [Alloscardovia sp. HMSC034E08]|uniref:cation-transporting P-type ATPase n=1 Tax=Alloscardovia sp. HMSC034E08 TaxID=1739413 RepID=UPI0008C996D6|nr:cation-transporting P-type ATPase [Alloscardovia sp. HMSC034E08]OFQ98666.1 hypothetical protein HMPREF2909_07430 [Alloscardovia sp. HMSC034E08]